MTNIEKKGNLISVDRGASITRAINERVLPQRQLRDDQERMTIHSNQTHQRKVQVRDTRADELVQRFKLQDSVSE